MQPLGYLLETNTITAIVPGNASRCYLSTLAQPHRLYILDPSLDRLEHTSFLIDSTITTFNKTDMNTPEFALRFRKIDLYP